MRIFKKKHLLLGVTILLLYGCGDSPAIQSKVQNLPGEDSSSALLLGQGFNNVTSEVLGHCVDLGELATQSGQETGSFAEYRLLEITSESQLREALNVNASGSLKFGIAGGGSARMSFAKSVNKNAKSRYLMVHSRVGNQLELATSFNLKTEAEKLLTQGDLNNFTKNCGNEFVYGRRTGGEFFSVFEFEFSDVTEEQKFSAAMSASGLGWKGSASLNHELQKFNMNAKIQVKMLRFGGSGILPDVVDLESYSREFPKMVDAVKGSPVTLELITKSYSGVEPFNISIKAPLLRAQNLFINTLAERYEAAIETLRTILYVKTNHKQFENFDVAYLNKKEQELSAFINVLKKVTMQCFEDPSDVQTCVMPDLVTPVVQFPDRIYLSLFERCEEMRQEAFKLGVISFSELKEWQEFDYIPVYKTSSKKQKILVAITYCEELN